MEWCLRPLLIRWAQTYLTRTHDESETVERVCESSCGIVLFHDRHGGVAEEVGIF